MTDGTSQCRMSSLATVVLSVLVLAACHGSAAYPASSNSLRDMDICNHWNGRRQFLDMGERGELHARNVTTTSTIYRSASSLFNGNRSAGNAGGNRNGGSDALTGVGGRGNGNRKSASHFGGRTEIWYQQCNLELVTCPECVIRITFTYLNFSRSCERTRSIAGSVGSDGDVGEGEGEGGDVGDGADGDTSSDNIQASSMCPCEYIQFSEPPYEAISMQRFCGDGKVFRTKTRRLLLKFFYRTTAGHVFSLQYFSERNVQIISGSPKQSILSGSSGSSSIAHPSPTAHIISTPFFPHTYPRDYGVENILTCEAENCHVRLDFSDFQLGLQSTLEIFDSNGQMLDSYTGEHFRPPITMSSGKSLLLQFRGNDATGVGFRAEVSFVSNKPLKMDQQLAPYTDCGGLVTGPGGAITMMNMSANSTDLRLYDCIWLIKPGNNYMMLKTHISLRVQEFSGLASRSELSIRQGSTSDSPLLECLTWPPSSGTSGKAHEIEHTTAGHVVPVLDGYYIRLRGVFGMSSKLAIVYSVFNYMNCYIGSEFLCGNNHCIAIRLHCDGFDHCGDNSDEPDSCEADWAHLHNDRRWYSHKPNFYFPKIEQYPDLKTATGIFIVSTLGIFAVLTGWMVILYRMGVRARQQRELQSHLQTISEFLEDRQDELPPDEPPSYEAPPDYEEVIKVGMEQELREPRSTGGRQQTQQQQQRCHHHHHRHHNNNNNNRHRDRNCSRVASSVTLQSTVPIHNGNELDSVPHAAASTSNAAAAMEQQNMQMLASRVLRVTGACGANCSLSASTSSTAGAAGASATDAAASTSSSSSTAAVMLMREATDNSICCAYRSVGVATSPLTPTYSSISGCDLSSAVIAGGTGAIGGAAAGGGNNHNNNNNTEHSEEFRDDSLNISFSLAMPTNDDCLTSPTSSAATLTTSNNNNINSCSDVLGGGARGGAGGNNKCMDHQAYLKRSWIVVNASGAPSYKMQRLRHTFSSPEAFAADEPFSADFMGYLPQERHYLPSHPSSQFAIELPRDFSTQSFFTPPQPPASMTSASAVVDVCRCACQLHNRHTINHNNNISVTPKTVVTKPDGISAEICKRRAAINGDDDDSVCGAIGGSDGGCGASGDDEHLLLFEMDSDGEGQEISCFGASVSKPQFRIGGSGGGSGGGGSSSGGANGSGCSGSGGSGGGKTRGTHVWSRRHVRSKSLTNSTAQQQSQQQQQQQPQAQQPPQQEQRARSKTSSNATATIRATMQRSSSADLLMCMRRGSGNSIGSTTSRRDHLKHSDSQGAHIFLI